VVGTIIVIIMTIIMITWHVQLQATMLQPPPVFRKHWLNIHTPCSATCLCPTILACVFVPAGTLGSKKAGTEKLSTSLHARSITSSQERCIPLHKRIN
jgi:hypothetical protein